MSSDIRLLYTCNALEIPHIHCGGDAKIGGVHVGPAPFPGFESKDWSRSSQEQQAITSTKVRKLTLKLHGERLGLD